MNNLTQQMWMWNIWISEGSGGYDLPKALDEAVVGMLLLWSGNDSTWIL